ncbi:DUF7568 family protein [Halogeometricum pallidum]
MSEHRNRCASHPASIARPVPVKWCGTILVDGYPVWSRGYETKGSTSFHDVFRQPSASELSCPACSSDDVLIGEKSADGSKVQRWYDWPRL